MAKSRHSRLGPDRRAPRHPRCHSSQLEATHASQLIDAGLDVVTISKRLGYKDPNITLKIYAHAFERANHKNKRKASKVINDALAGASRS
jgi:integrase